ncbi:MAG: gamma-glutamyltransferase [Dehalococcoidia bacterium]|nr:gamma-glutamyltransferase [Dehalococcoidia bacterium]
MVQMLKIFEGFDVAGMGFGTPDAVHLTAEAMKIAFADRFQYMADPLTTDIPLDWLTSNAYAAERRCANRYVLRTAVLPRRPERPRRRLYDHRLRHGQRR